MSGFDLVIRNGTVVDGTGAPPFKADIAIVDDQIASIGPNLILSRDREAKTSSLQTRAELEFTSFAAI